MIIIVGGFTEKSLKLIRTLYDGRQYAINLTIVKQDLRYQLSFPGLHFTKIV